MTEPKHQQHGHPAHKEPAPEPKEPEPEDEDTAKKAKSTVLRVPWTPPEE